MDQAGDLQHLWYDKKEGNSSAPEFTLVQVETKTSLVCTLKKSMKILIMITKVAVVAVDNDVIRNCSDTW